MDAEVCHGIHPGDVLNGVRMLESAMVDDTLSFVCIWDGVKVVQLSFLCCWDGV